MASLEAACDSHVPVSLFVVRNQFHDLAENAVQAWGSGKVYYISGNTFSTVGTPVDARSDVNRMLGLDFKFTLADSDLPKVRQMCAAAGVEVRFPFLEPELVDFAARLPVAEKVTVSRLRCFYKEATSGFLPDEVIKKKKHGFGLPFGIWLNEHRALREWSYDLLDRLSGRSIVRPGYVQQLKDELVPSLPRYYGPLVWNLIVLESWMEEHDAHL